jgi:hypothetical protein
MKRGGEEGREGGGLEGSGRVRKKMEWGGGGEAKERGEEMFRIRMILSAKCTQNSGFTPNGLKSAFKVSYSGNASGNTV